ncbi:hypothetical protein [Pseudoxanthomonas japonensis]|uniref:hypothetical protein n=1 Tax=Pseudoxanthomonas japonensis TaxID=69284 RepID=UPI001BCBA409|nr:hypothetical protein [Pseudoxanthomonas japonensis]MCR6625894.1 hypothetical protein [Pseudoxanthomonas sp.]
MKAVAALVFLSWVSLSVSAGAPERVQFIATLQLDDAAPVALDLQLPSKQSAKLRLSDGSTLELATPGNSASPEGALIKLITPSGEVMHTATIPDSGLTSTSFAYQVCAGEVTYMSPAPAIEPASRARC